MSSPVDSSQEPQSLTFLAALGLQLNPSQSLPEHRYLNNPQLRISEEVIVGQNYQFITSGTLYYYSLQIQQV